MHRHERKATWPQHRLVVSCNNWINWQPSEYLVRRIGSPHGAQENPASGFGCCVVRRTVSFKLASRYDRKRLGGAAPPPFTPPYPFPSNGDTLDQHGCFIQPVQIVDRAMPLLQCDQAVGSQLLDGTIYVDRR